jgi:hypothetical protein
MPNGTSSGERIQDQARDTMRVDLARRGLESLLDFLVPNTDKDET